MTSAWTAKRSPSSSFRSDDSSASRRTSSVGEAAAAENRYDDENDENDDVGKLRFELNLGDGRVFAVETSRDDDAAREAARIATELGRDDDVDVDVDGLRESILDHRRAPKYEGPVASSSFSSSSSIVLPSGLALEVGPSTVHGAGEGLFVRAVDGDAVLQTAGSAFCGYARGRTVSETDLVNRGGGYAAEFRLTDGLDESQVWFRGRLATIGEVLTEVEAEYETKTRDVRVLGHVVVRDDEGVVVGLDPPVRGEPSARFFVPDDDQPSPLTVRTAGHKANDLAGGTRDGGDDPNEYDARSERANLLVLVPQVRATERPSGGDDDDDETVVVWLESSGPPIFTVARTVLIRNREPMEVGCAYGFQYWQTPEYAAVGHDEDGVET